MVIPIITAARRQSASITDAYLARKLGRAPFGVGQPRIRKGASLEEVYGRPFVTLWKSLGESKPYAQALAGAEARAVSTAAMDVQLSMREAANEIERADDNIYGYERVANPGACEFCQLVDGAYVKSGSAMALHNYCGCGLEPLTAPHSRAAKLPSGVAVSEHGELGPVLGSPDHDFTSAADIPAL